MNIGYSYEIVSVDEQARCMEIVYSAEGHQTLHVGARLPYVGETVEQIVRMYEPTRFWEEQKLEVVVPAVGEAGILEPLPVANPNPDVIVQPQPVVQGAQVI